MKGKKLMLVIAGISLAACGSAAEVGNGSAGSASPTLTMPVTRAAHAAIGLADGRVLLIGGCVRESCEAGPETGRVDAYDPRSGRFAPAGRLLEPRVSTTIARLASGEILLAGGWVGSSVTASIEIFNPATGRSRRAGDLAEARADITAAILADGRILLAGGYAGGTASRVVEIFDPRDSTVKRAGDLTVPRAGAGAALLADGRVLIAGGGTGSGGTIAPTATAEIFDPRDGRSTPTGSLAQARYKHAVVALRDGRVLAIGGSDSRDRNGKLDTVESFDPATGAFTPAGTLVEPRFKIAGTVLLLASGKVLVAGGAPRAELYDPETSRSVLVGPDFARRLNFATATMLAGGRVLVAGGYDEEGIRMNDQAWVLRPED